MNKLNENVFESIKHYDEFGIEYWSARELQKVLEYSQWRRLEDVIKKAMKACENSGYNVSEHFANVGKVLKVGNNANMNLRDYKLSRYACYLMAQNGDARKKVIALAQTYFAIQTRKQEILENEYEQLSEDEKRLYMWSLTKKGNYNLNQTALKSGVKNFDKFHNYGYRGLYNETANEIAKRKNLRYREDILDNMGSSEHATNLFRIEQTNEKLKKDNIEGETNANITHYNVGKNIREVIKKNGGTMPEELPTPNKSLKEIEKNKINLP